LLQGRGVEILLETFKNIDNREAVIVFMGYGELEGLIKNTVKEYKNIYFHQAVESTILLDYTSSADFGTSTIEDSCLSYRYSLPNKMFEYIMAEIPVIVSNLQEMKKFVYQNGVGVVTSQNNPKGLQKAIEEATLLNRAELQKNIEKTKKIYNWEEQEKNLLKLYNQL
jgi:glycosyltransferase involved in cell wall biosynthesis